MDHGQITRLPEIIPRTRTCDLMTIRLAALARGLLKSSLTAALLVGLFPRAASGQG